MAEETIIDKSIWLVMQLSDTSFPGGSLANSGGLESALKLGYIEKNNTDSLIRYIDLILQQVVHQMIPFVATAHQFTYLNDLHSNFYQLDSYCHAVLTNEVSRRCSINQGKCFFRVIVTGTLSISDQLNLLNTSEQKLNFHHAPLFGITCGFLKISLESTIKVYLRIALRDLISASARLGIIGPMEGVSVQVLYINKLESWIENYLTPIEEPLIDSCDPCSSLIPRFYNGKIPRQCAPIVDIIQSQQDLLYTRLFNS